MPRCNPTMADQAADNAVFARFVFCDDFRQEVNGKHSLMGVYGQVMGVSGSPAALPKLVAVTSLSLPASEAGHEVVLQLHDGPNMLAEARLQIAAPPATAALAADPRFTRRLNVTVPMELIGFEVRDGMRLVLSADIAGRHHESEPLEVAFAAQPTSH